MHFTLCRAREKTLRKKREALYTSVCIRLLAKDELLEKADAFREV
jgi:hypothetical protein